MKKLILGLLLIFSFSYGEENLYLTYRDDVLALTSSYSKRLFDLPHLQTREIVTTIIRSYEREFGSQSLMNVSMCMTNFTTGYFKNLDECGVTADMSGMKYYLKGIDEDYKNIIIAVITSFGAALIEIAANAEKELEYENKNKKRI